MNERQNPMGCPDAEMLAAWSDGGLRADERSLVEEHAAGCGRCQAQLAAMARIASVGPFVSQARRFRLRPWLLPAAGAAAAIIVWVVVQPTRLPEPPQRTTPQLQARKEDKQTRSSDAIPLKTESDAAANAPGAAPQSTEGKLEGLGKERRARDVSAPPAASPAPVAQDESLPTAAAARFADAMELRGLVVHRSPEGRVTWETNEGISARLTAGASPSQSVIWLVGKGGLVLLSTDARSWRHLLFPEPVDLIGIEASSDAAATVTTADARVFTTADGGVTWQRK